MQTQSGNVVYNMVRALIWKSRFCLDQNLPKTMAA